MNKLHLYLLAAALAVCGIALVLYKAVVLQLPIYADQRTELWRVETELKFQGKGGPAKVTLQLPNSRGRLQIIDQSYVSSGYGLTIAADELGQQAVFSTAQASGEQVLYNRVVVTRLGTEDEESRESAPEVRRPSFAPPARIAAQAILDAERARAADAETLAALIAQRLRNAVAGDEASFLLGAAPTTSRIVTVTAELLALADIPARAVHGIALEPERRHVEFVHWLEVYGAGRWRSVHEAEAKPEIIKFYLPWWRGRAPFASVEGGSGLTHHITVSRTYELSMQTALKQRQAMERQLVEFSLFGLPLQTQFLFRSLLVIPVGIFLLVVLRNVVGIKTFGTFMPVLIALAFRETGIAWGLIFFSIIVAIGLSVRFYLDRLKLLLVPRLAVGVIVVVLIIAALTVLFHRLGFARGLSIGLFPIVILTMTIERMSLVWEENGAREALQQAAGSLVVGVIAFLVMNVAPLEHFLFVFPEALLVVLAATLLLGRYSGYRITELWRFRELAR